MTRGDDIVSFTTRVLVSATGRMSTGWMPCHGNGRKPSFRSGRWSGLERLMTQICAGAFCIGFLIAFVLSFLPFAGSLTLSIVMGAGLSLASGRSIGETVLFASSIWIACQVGYGIGLAAVACGDRVWRMHQRWRQPNDAAAVKRLRSGRK